MYQVLIVEPDPSLAQKTARQLLHGAYASDTVFSGYQALASLGRGDYDLILLSDPPPDLYLDQLCLKIRHRSPAPMICLGCDSGAAAAIHALQSGCDDYMRKPVDYGELVARADAILRRTGRSAVRSAVQRAFRQFTVDTAHRLIIRGNSKVELSAIEYALLSYLSSHPNMLLTYSALYKVIWNSDSLGDVRTLMVHISNLRKKIDPLHTGIIQTVRGAGYIFSDI